MSPAKDAAQKIEKMIRASRLNDLDTLLKDGQVARINEVSEAVSRLEPGGYLIGCGPYTQGIYRLSGERRPFSAGKPRSTKVLWMTAPDFSLNDVVTFKPREISRRHFQDQHAKHLGMKTSSI